MAKRIFIAVLFFVLGVNSASARCADCKGKGIWAWPEETHVAPNAIFKLEGYAVSEEIIENLNEYYPVYLQADSHRVDLEVMERHKGQHHLMQALLKPKELLKPGKKYFLKIDDLDEFQAGQLHRKNDSTHQEEAIYWIVKDSVDNKPPVLIAEPKLMERISNHLSCGPETFAVFDLPVEDSSAVLAICELSDTNFTESHTFIFPIEADGQVHVGHGMCFGGIRYKIGHAYKIRFRLIDASGNKEDEFTDWIVFESPFTGY